VLGDFGLAEDAAQEAFVDTYVNLATLRDQLAFPGWLRRLVYTHCNRSTRRRRLATVSLENATNVKIGEPEPPEIVGAKEIRSLVIGKMAELPEHERSVVTLFYIGEHSHKEISRFLDISVSAVKFRYHSARKKLKKSLLTMVRREVTEQRPSRNDDFTDKVCGVCTSTKLKQATSTATPQHCCIAATMSATSGTIPRSRRRRTYSCTAVCPIGSSSPNSIRRSRRSARCQRLWES
jgi:RNA polymerase sigma factor (sigma-70 family)